MGSPATSIMSFTVKGTPCSGPSAASPPTAASAALASARAASARTTVKALTWGCTAATRAKMASTSSTGEIWRAAIRRAASAPER